MDTAWLNAWLAYVHLLKGVSPAPGPCSNERLLVADHEKEAWVTRDDLVMAAGNRPGDYRRVSPQTWEILCKYYPNSGPAIRATFKKVASCSDINLFITVAQ